MLELENSQKLPLDVAKIVNKTNINRVYVYGKKNYLCL